MPRPNAIPASHQSAPAGAIPPSSAELTTDQSPATASSRAETSSDQSPAAAASSAEVTTDQSAVDSGSPPSSAEVTADQCPAGASDQSVGGARPPTAAQVRFGLAPEPISFRRRVGSVTALSLGHAVNDSYA